MKFEGRATHAQRSHHCRIYLRSLPAPSATTTSTRVVLHHLANIIIPKSSSMSLRSLLPPKQAHNIHTLRQNPLSEISGSLGDLGTLLPLLLALTLTSSINLPTTLVFTGLANILTGIYFRIPLPVQPMKAIAAVAIANNFSITETTSAGIFVAAVVFFGGVTGLLGWVGRTVPVPVVKGIQVGAGLTLAISGGTMIGGTSWWHGDSRILAFFAFLALLITSRPEPMGASSSRPRIPYALLVTVVGIVTGIAVCARSSDGLPFMFASWRPSTYIPSPSDFRTGVLSAGLGQLPLTTLNSIIAVTHLSAELLPSPPYPAPPSFSALGGSVGIINLVACWFGAMPICHGSGGLAGQVKFGARSGASVILLGLVKLVLGLVVNEAWLVRVLEQFPKSLLGVMVIAAGLELARVGEGLNSGARDLLVEADAGHEGDGKSERELSEKEKTERWYTMIVTVALLLAFKNDGVGFVGGLLTHMAIKAPEYWQSIRRSRDGQPSERSNLLQN